MQCVSQYLTTSIFQLHPNPNPKPSFISPVKAATHNSNQTLTHVSRRQNSKLFINTNQPELDEDKIRRKLIIEEASILTKRIARFPGSIDLPTLNDYSKSDGLVIYESNDEDIKKAIEIRRGVVREILKSALRAGRLSVRFVTNLVERLDGFVDRVVIQAAAMKDANEEFRHVSFNVRAKNYIQSSGVVALVKWLKHNSMTYPQIGKVICTCTGELEQVRLAAEWLKLVYVKGKYIGTVFAKACSIMNRDLEEMESIVDYLIENGVKSDWIGFVVTRCPQVLTLTKEELVLRVKFYMDMNMNKVDFGTMVFEYPRVLGYFSLDEMNSKVQYLKEFGLTTEDVGRLLAIKPQLMGCSIEERWKPLVKYLYYLGVRRDGIKRILFVKPMIFCVGLEETIAPKVRFLQDLGIREEAIGSAIVKFPPLLTYSLYKKIRPVVIFLMTKAGVTQSDIAKVIAFDPQLVGCSIVHKLEVNVKYFLSLGIRVRALGEMIADFPMLLRYNLDIIGPKYRYLRRVMVRPLQDLIEFPRYLSYSLEDRIIPRHKIIVESQINMKLRYMLPGSDEAFNERVHAAIENRRRFESGDAHIYFADSGSSPV